MFAADACESERIAWLSADEVRAAIRRGEIRDGLSLTGLSTAFALGMLALVGPRFPERLRAFMLTVVVVDDVVNDITVYGFDQTVLYHNGEPAVLDRGRELGMTNRIDRVPA